MGEFWIQLLALLTLLHQTGSASDTPELIRAVGGSVTFRSPSTDGNGAFWSFGDDPIVTVEFGDPPRPVFLKEKYKTHFTVSERGRALSISQLRMEDAGTYSVNIDGKISTFILRVYRDLTEPTVTCKTQDCLDRICRVSLLCSVTGTGFGNVSYTWKGWNRQWEERSMVVAEVDKSSLDNLDPLRCTARNAVSRRSVTITIPGGLCPAENLAHHPGPDALSGIGIGIGMGIGIGFSVLLLVFLVFLCKSKGYCPACQAHRARGASGLSEISATAGPVHRGSPQAMRLLEPALGPAWDKRRPQSRWTVSDLAWITGQPGPEPGLALDKRRAGSGPIISTLPWVTNQLGPEPGLNSHQHDSHGVSGEHLMGTKHTAASPMQSPEEINPSV